MDPLKNPFAPGAGNRPPELAGRDQVLDEIGLALSRVIAGRHDRGHLLKGLRGVGKTVLLNEIDTIAQERGYETALIEAPEDGSSPNSSFHGCVPRCYESVERRRPKI